MIVILDDRDDVWKDSNPGNVLRIVPYHFWTVTWDVDQNHVKKTGAQPQYPSLEARISELAAHDNTDVQLPVILGVLRGLHTQFFGDALKPSPPPLIGRGLQGVSEDGAGGKPLASEQPAKLSLGGRDVKELLRLRKLDVLKGVEVVFSRCFDLRYAPHENDLWLKLLEFGGQGVEELKSSVTHVVATRYGTAKVNQAIKRKKVVVHLDWLKESIKAWRRLDESHFGLGELLMRPKPAEGGPIVNHRQDFCANQTANPTLQLDSSVSFALRRVFVLLRPVGFRALKHQTWMAFMAKTRKISAAAGGGRKRKGPEHGRHPAGTALWNRILTAVLA